MLHAVEKMISPALDLRQVTVPNRVESRDSGGMNGPRRGGSGTQPRLGKSTGGAAG
jgi:hypothetical protein